MRAARLHEYTADVGSAFTVEEVDRPTVEAPDDVVIEVEAAGWCHTDNHIVEGSMQEIAGATLPYTPGHENAGVVSEVGEGVTRFSPGDTVVVHPAASCGLCRACRLGQDMYCPDHTFVGIDADGGFAEYLKTKERSLIALDSLDPVQAAPHADAGVTAAPVAPGTTGEKAGATPVPVTFKNLRRSTGPESCLSMSTTGANPRIAI